MPSAKAHVMTLKRRILKQKMVEAMGGKCAICGYNKSNSALEFHHLDPAEKDFSLGHERPGGYSAWPKIVSELRKCVILCSNCHREVHDRTTIIPNDISKPVYVRDYAE